eukprot:31042-Pelagococcus_subviridis.AAC.6
MITLAIKTSKRVWAISMQRAREYPFLPISPPASRKYSRLAKSRPLRIVVDARGHAPFLFGLFFASTNELPATTRTRRPPPPPPPPSPPLLAPRRAARRASQTSPSPSGSSEKSYIIATLFAPSTRILRSVGVDRSDRSASIEARERGTRLVSSHATPPSQTVCPVTAYSASLRSATGSNPASSPCPPVPNPSSSPPPPSPSSQSPGAPSPSSPRSSRANLGMSHTRTVPSCAPLTTCAAFLAHSATTACRCPISLDTSTGGAVAVAAAASSSRRARHRNACTTPELLPVSTPPAHAAMLRVALSSCATNLHSGAALSSSSSPRTSNATTAPSARPAYKTPSSSLKIEGRRGGVQRRQAEFKGVASGESGL